MEGLCSLPFIITRSLFTVTDNSIGVASEDPVTATFREIGVVGYSFHGVLLCVGVEYGRLGSGLVSPASLSLGC